MKKFQEAARMHSLKNSIFMTLTAQANKYQAINLGQGFPDTPPPEFVRQAIAQEARTNLNQYAPSSGTVKLRQSLQEFYKKQYQLDYDANTEITATIGATQGIFVTILSIVNPGDEVILLEPCYDSYSSCVELAGGKVISIELKAEEKL